MTHPIFVRPHRKYDSYTDFYRLVELSGFQTIEFDEIDPDRPVTYIVSPINRTLPRWSSNRSSRFVYWNLERPDVDTVPFWDLPGFGIHASIDSVMTQFDEVWVSDRHLASLDPRFRHVVLASDARLAEGKPEVIKYHFCHLSYVWGRRNEVIPSLERRLKCGPNGWGAERASVIRQSQFMLNIHQTPAPVMEPLRFALAAAYGIPVISETMKDPYPLVSGTHFLEVPFEGAVQEVIKIVSQPLPELAGYHLHDELCRKRTFASEVMAALR